MSIVEKELHALQNYAKAEYSKRFFKTEPGQYAHGDIFLGVSVPQIRSVIKKHKNLSLKSIEQLLQSPLHECRLAALLLLVEKYKCSDVQERTEIVELYLRNREHVNNWDLVDSSAHKIIGSYCDEMGDMSIMETLATSGHLWSERIAVIASLHFIAQGKFDITLALAECFLHHPHDLMQKAVGWMLREVGKKDDAVLKQFLEKHAKQMPRTMLRYAIEKLAVKERQHFMQKA